MKTNRSTHGAVPHRPIRFGSHLVGELEEVETDEAREQGSGAVDDHVVVVGLELALQELELVAGDRLDDVLAVRGGKEEHARLALPDLVGWVKGLGREG